MCPRDGFHRPAVRIRRAQSGPSSPPPEAPSGARARADDAIKGNKRRRTMRKGHALNSIRCHVTSDLA